MKTATSSNENVILGLTAFLVAAFTFFFFAFQTKERKVSRSETHNINYEMAKVKSTESLYSLDGREIDRETTELETLNNTKSLNTNAEQSISKNKNVAAAQLVAKPKDAKNKKPAVVKAIAKKSDPTKVIAKDSKQSFDIQDATAEIKKLNTDAKSSNYGLQRNVSNQDVNNANTDKDSEIKKDAKTIAQWAQEILASEDRQVVLKFVTAYRNKEVTEAGFYTVVNQLLNSTLESKKGFGLYALRATPSYTSYVMLVKNQSALNSSYQSYVQETLLSYHQSGTLNYLKQALASNDKQVILKTIEIVKVGFIDIKNGTTSDLVDSRYRRDNDFGSFAVQNYQSFVPQLIALQNQSQQTGDQDVFSAAQQLTQSIQSTAVIAAN
jgi:hypothetical protein